MSSKKRNAAGRKRWRSESEISVMMSGRLPRSARSSIMRGELGTGRPRGAKGMKKSELRRSDAMLSSRPRESIG